MDKDDTTTTLTADPASSLCGQTATVTADAPGSGTPTGTVNFYDGDSLLATVTLVDGVTSYSTSALSIGEHTIRAVYGGDANFNGSEACLDYTVAGIVGIPISETAGVAFTDNIGTIVLPSTDTNPSDYTVEINWGEDGVAATEGWLEQSGATIYVAGSSMYDAAGDYTISITVTGAGYTIPGTSTASVVDPPLFTSNTLPSGAPLNTTVGEAITAPLISFSDLWTGTQYTACINFGDGSPAQAGDVEENPDGTYSVYTDYEYAKAGTYLLSVTVDGTRNGVSSPVTFYRTASVASGILGSGLNLSATQGDTTGPVAVATFTDPDVSETAADYTAYIDWGDGSAVDAGVVTDDGGYLTVSSAAGHVYAEPGTYATDVLLQDDHAEASAYGMVTVSPELPWGNIAPSIPTDPWPITETVGVAGSDQVLATFTDADDLLPSDAFAVQVHWGDGTGWQLATVSGGSGNYEVAGGHTYAAAGDYLVEVEITGVNGAVQIDTTVVARSALTATAETWEETAAVPTGDLLPDTDPPPNMLLATFTDQNLTTTAGDYEALVNWGDGGGTEEATVTGSGGQFAVSGEHAYTNPGVYSINVWIADETGIYGTEVEAQTTVTVTEAAAGEAVPSQLLNWTVNENEYDPDATSDMTATLDWGDPPGDTAGAPELNYLNKGVYELYSSAAGEGGYTYSAGGTYTLSGTTTETDGPSTSWSQPFQVAGYPLIDETSELTAPEATAGAVLDDPVVAQFVDTNPNGVWSDYTATINWGDGTSPDGGTVVAAEGAQTYDVEYPSHTYAEAGWYQVSVIVSDADWSMVTTMEVEVTAGPTPASWTATAVQRQDDTSSNNAGTWLPFGEALIAPNTGSVRISQPLDFDQSGGTSLGGNTALAYNSLDGGAADSGGDAAERGRRGRREHHGDSDVGGCRKRRR